MKDYNSDKEWSIEVIEEDFVEALRVAESLGLTVCCGEWGCLSTVGDELRMRYYRELGTLFKKHDIAWVVWDYKGSFGMIDFETQEIDWE
ncbi:hypothetical protein MLD52_12915 [Puniceicoccaceae bacterium K14]|nr:hypothetical protein [Puniceicoccaceae bacterium K14]